MQSCPHCEEKTIGNWEKLWSITVSPVQCPACGRYSFLHAAHALKGLTFWVVVTWIFIALAWYSQQAFLLLGSVPAFYLAVNRFMLEAPMQRLGE